METFLAEWYKIIWVCTSLSMYLGVFFKDRGKMVQDGSYGFWLLVGSVIIGFIWIFTIPLFIVYLLTQIPKAINWFLDGLKSMILPSSYDNWQ